MGPSVNASEIKKLIAYSGRSALVLLEFSDDPIHWDYLQEYRKIPEADIDNVSDTGFNVIYCFKEKNTLGKWDAKCEMINVRVPSRI